MQLRHNPFDRCFEAILEILTRLIECPDPKVAYRDANGKDLSISHFGRLSKEKFAEMSNLILNHKKLLLKTPAGGIDL